MPKVAKPRRHGARWQINWKDGTGKRRFKTYDSYKEAAAALARHQSDAQAVRSGEKVLLPQKIWADLEAHFETVKAGKRSLGDDKSRMRLHRAR